MKYNWAVIGCGHIAGEMARALKDENCGFYGVWGRNQEKANAYAKEYDIKNVYGSVEELLSDKKVDIVYIATPHNTHIDFLRKALTAGKHVLCEKAITLNSDELCEAEKIAQSGKLILAEAMTIFHCPVYDKIKRIVSSGELGRLKTVEVNLGSYKDYDMTNRFFSPALAGGAMLDIGVYALSFVRFMMTEKPGSLYSLMAKAPTGVDEQVNIILQNGKNEMATVNLSLVSKLPKLAIAAYEKGYVTFENYNRTSCAEIVFTESGEVRKIEVENDRSPLYHEVCDMENAVSGEENKMYLPLTKDVMDIMTKVRYEHKMLYPEEMK